MFIIQVQKGNSKQIILINKYILHFSNIMAMDLLGRDLEA